MNANEARDCVKRLTELRTMLERAKENVKRRRNLRASEKAMTMSSYGMDIVSLTNAIDLMVATHHVKL
jgi:hypothetical protein